MPGHREADEEDVGAGEDVVELLRRRLMIRRRRLGLAQIRRQPVVGVERPDTGRPRR